MKGTKGEPAEGGYGIKGAKVGKEATGDKFYTSLEMRNDSFDYSVNGKLSIFAQVCYSECREYFVNGKL